MALSALRLRRPLLLHSSAALRRAFTLATPRCFSGLVSSPGQVRRAPAPIWLLPSASFRSTPAASSPKKSTPKKSEKAKPAVAEEDSDDDVVVDTIMFEGCDYKHWLITLDFPKDPLPPEEEMIETYVQTCALGLGCSIEEAKKKIYACSTTVYHGFQALMSEEQSERFRGLPGVVFILPDSYIDPENKEYGGDKYINGTIIYRPRRGGMQVRYPRNKPDPPKVSATSPSPSAPSSSQ